MDLSEQGNMLTEISSGENVGQMKRGVSGIDLGGNLSISHTPCESSCAGTDESSVLMLKSDVADPDLLFAFDSISVSERVKLNNGVGTSCADYDAFDPIGQGYLSGHRFDNEKDNCKYNSADSTSIPEPSSPRDGAGEASVGVDQGGKLNLPLIVYTSSRRSASKTKLRHKESPKSLKCRRMASRNSMVNLSSLQMLRKCRTSFSKRAESSGWVGYMGNIPDSEENSRADLNLVNEKKLTTEKGGKGKKNCCRDMTREQSNGNRCTPTGRIFLKIKIGNKICGMNTATERLTPTGKGTPELSDTMENKLREEVPEVVVPPHERNLEKMMSSTVCLSSTRLEAKSAFDKLSFNSSSDFHHVISPEDSHNLGAASENMCSDIGTSPDSEVINTAPDAPLCEKGLPDLQESSTIPKVCVSSSDISNLILSPKKSMKGNKNDQLHQLSRCTLKIRLPGAESLNNAKVPSFHRDLSSSGVPQTKSKKEKKKKKLHNAGDCSMKSMHVATETRDDAKVHLDYGVGETAADAMNTSSGPYSICAETNPCSVPASAILCTNSDVSNRSVPCSNGLNFTKHSRGKGGSKGRSRIIDLPNKKDKTSKRKGNKNSASGEHQANDNFGASDILRGVESCLAADAQKDQSGTLQFSSSVVREPYLPLRNAWVLCDECQKWRRIPSTLADQIEETDCRWTCKENTDKDFADCSIPQEKSNSEINEELEISGASGEEDDAGAFWKSNQNRPKVPQQSSWSLIKSNLFLHRSRKTQPIDEVMVCHCKPPSDGKMGCGAKCLNRMLNIECVKGTCPCGELCSNQQFQKRKYAKLKWFRCGKKGYGLQALKDISQGQFLIEYVGEVLDVHAYEARQREYALDGHRHFYFMTLNGSEVIDACAKGNLARFINHSCSPNCRTEKWMVNGEVCIGLFALKDIKEGEEVTFDYNYVRVFGAAAKKCVCGSPSCRGYIGGDPTNSEVIVQDDSDDEFSEPVMTCGDRELNEDWRDIMLNSANVGENEIVNEPPGNRFIVEKLINTVGESITDSYTSEPLTRRVEGVCSQVEEAAVRDTFVVGSAIDNDSMELLNTIKVKGESSNGSISADFEAGCEGLQAQMHSSHCMDISLQTGGLLDKATSSIHGLSVAASPSKSLLDTVEPKRKLKNPPVGGRGELATPNSLPKTNRSTSVRKGKPKTNVIRDKGSLDLDKLNTALNKSRKLHEPTVNSHFEAVEEKLNELLDPEGGISKRKDASRGYLKLLFLTAASGNNGHGEAIQSSRDLSMILDALLKTRSRTVLVDIINKNGLQMLHNIMKRYRKEFIKTPILRKLLKVLEYLAVREILTLEHITGGPPRVGVESFKDSMLTLTEHADKQVHQIARNFRDRWIPRSLRKNYCLEREQKSGFSDLSVPSDKGMKSLEVKCYSEKQSLAAPGTGETCTVDLSSVSGSSNGTNPVSRPKRKSRWDNPKRKSRWDNPVAEYPHSRTRMNLAPDGHLETDADTPPGFSSPCTGPVAPPSASSTGIHRQEIPMCIKQHPFDAVLGDSQLRFSSHLSVSYGIPYSVKQQLGIQPETSNSWTVAPAVPFHPFPPLPQYARGEGALPSSTAACASMNEDTEKATEHSNASVTSHNGQNYIRTSSLDPSKNNLAFANQQHDFPQGASCSLGRTYFRQQKWNHSKFGPPWVRMRNGRGDCQSNSRNDSPGVTSTDGANDFGDVYNS